MLTTNCTKCDESETGRCFVCEACELANQLTHQNAHCNLFVLALAYRLALVTALSAIKHVKPERYDWAKKEIERIASLAILINNEVKGTPD